MKSARSLSLGFLMFAYASFGQGPVANVSGVIHDPSGAAVPNVVVKSRNLETNVSRSTVTNDTGVYTLVGLSPGQYEISAEAGGFRRAVRSDLTLQVAQDARIDFALELGATTDTVNVNAEAPVTDTESASTGTVIDNHQVVELPLNGRQFYGLALLVPGVNLSAENSTTGYRGGFNVSGRPETNNNFTVNGLDNNDQSVNAPSVRPSVDDIQEFKLLTGIYPAEYGRSSGGQVVVVTKSGTNSLHGTLFEFLRNQKLDAVNYFTQAGSKPSFRRNNFGATLGGPIKKDKTFFHFSYEGLRLAEQVAALGTVPTAAEINGDFSTLLSTGKTIKNPLTGAIFPGNIIPPTLINPIGQQLLKEYPAATVPTVSGAPSNNYFLNGVQSESLNQYSVRVDHSISPSDSLTGSYQYFLDPVYYVYNVLCGSSVLPNGGCYTGWTAQLFSLAENHVFSSTLLNEVRVGVQRMRQPRLQTDSNINFWGPFGITNVGAAVPGNTGVPSATITGYSKLGGPTNLPQNRWDTTYDYRDTLSWQKGAHALKMGVEFRPFDTNFTFVSSGRGALTFNASTAAPTSGYALADVLLGYPTTTSNNPLAPPIYGRTKSFFAFAQDDWKVTSKFTLNYGIRWEYNTPYTDAQNRLSTFDLVTGTIVQQNTNGGPSTLYRQDYRKFAPRLGMAYQPFGDGKTVIRAGAGVFFDNVITFNGLPIVTTNPPYRAPATYTSNLVTPITLFNPFPLGSATGFPAVAGIVPDYTTPDVYEWTFGIQRQLFGGTLLDVTYLGSRGTHLPLEINPNQPPPGPGSATQVQAERPYPTFANVTLLESSNLSTYESLQVKLEKRAANGIAFLLSETYGKSIDSGASAGSTSNSSKVLPQNSYNAIAGEAGLSDYNVKSRLVLSVIAELPFGKGKPWLSNGFGAKLAGGWQVSSIVTYETGRPWTPYFAANISNTSELADRPNVVPGCNLYSGFQTVSKWVNPACFTTPAAGTFGDLGRNTLIGPGLVNVDFAVDRSFQINDRIRLQFRAESFNIANHPNFNLPSTAYDSPTFATLTSAMDPRQLQFGLKVIF
jgi:hypothetical protein